MCSIGEDDFGDDGGRHAMQPDEPDVGFASQNGEESILCSKCQQPVQDPYKLKFRAPECKDCFLKYVRHKFRATLGSSKILPKDARVLVLLDGSEESLVLLDMMYHGQAALDNFKRLHCSAIVLYIDDYHLRREQAYNTLSVVAEEHLGVLDRIQTVLSDYPLFQSYIMPLLDEDKAIEMLKTSEEYRRQVRAGYQQSDGYCDTLQSFSKQMSCMKSSTSRRDFQRHQRQKLISLAAKYHQCQFIFMPDLATTLASTLLVNVTLGRGASAALDVSLQDNRYLKSAGVQFVRPFKELSQNEIHLYIRACNLEDKRLLLRQRRVGKDVDCCEDDDNDGSIQALTQRFINQLQCNFTATVSTVSRTGDKLKLTHNPNESLDKTETRLNCCFCNSILDCEVSTTLNAIEYSSRVSNDLDHRQELILDSALGAASSSNADSHFRDLCYGCRNIFTECTDRTLMEKTLMANKR